MKKSQLIRILRTFDKKEIREFRKWVNSPAHNLRQDVGDLFEYLAAGSHLYSDASLEKEKVFEAVYPGKTYSDAELRQAMHFLLKNVEEFLVYNELLQDEVRAQTTLAKVYRQRQLPKLFHKSLDAGRKTQEQQPYRNHHYFENEYLLQFEEFNYLSNLGRSVPLNLQELSITSDTAFIINKLQIASIMLSHQKVFKTDYDTGLLENILNHVEKNPALLENHAIAIYYYSYKSGIESNNEQHFQNLKEQINRHGHLFPPNEIRNTYLLAINYCIGRINAGDFSFYRETFELFKGGMEKGLFLENGILSRFTFSNALIAGLNLKEYKWVENFIHEYSPFLEEKHRNSYVGFYLARLHYEQKNYGDAMKLFAQSDYDDPLMTLNAKTMLLKMYYELDEFNALDSLLGSMKTYLQRKKVMGYHKNNYKNIIHYTKKLLKVTPYDKDQKLQLKQELESANPLTERKWLLAQLENL